jgi:hypothetical protein
MEILDVTALWTTIATSAIVSSAVTFVLKTYFENRMKAHFDLELEKAKHEHKIREDASHELVGRKLRAYPTLVELAYRVRNIARELVRASDVNPTFKSELESRVRELEDSLYQFRIDLERDGLFLLVHSYKGLSKEFTRSVGDLVFVLASADPQTNPQNLRQQMRSIYDELDSKHKEVIDKLSAASVPPA